MTSPHLRSIHVATTGGEPMQALDGADVTAGGGIDGDRYATARGEWSYDPRLCNEVTLVAAEALEAALTETGVDLRDGRSRRNLTTVGVDLDALVGREFLVGEVRLRGDRPCHPCPYLDGVTEAGARAALTDRGGLRATVVSGGRLHVGDAVQPV